MPFFQNAHHFAVNNGSFNDVAGDYHYIDNKNFRTNINSGNSNTNNYVNSFNDSSQRHQNQYHNPTFNQGPVNYIDEAKNVNTGDNFGYMYQTNSASAPPSIGTPTFNSNNPFNPQPSPYARVNRPPNGSPYSPQSSQGQSQNHPQQRRWDSVADPYPSPNQRPQRPYSSPPPPSGAGGGSIGSQGQWEGQGQPQYQQNARYNPNPPHPQYNEPMYPNMNMNRQQPQQRPQQQAAYANTRQPNSNPWASGANTAAGLGAGLEALNTIPGMQGLDIGPTGHPGLANLKAAMDQLKKQGYYDYSGADDDEMEDDGGSMYTDGNVEGDDDEDYVQSNTRRKERTQNATNSWNQQAQGLGQGAVKGKGKGKGQQQRDQRHSASPSTPNASTSTSPMANLDSLNRVPRPSKANSSDTVTAQTPIAATSSHPNSIPIVIRPAASPHTQGQPQIQIHPQPNPVTQQLSSSPNPSESSDVSSISSPLANLNLSPSNSPPAPASIGQSNSANSANNLPSMSTLLPSTSSDFGLRPSSAPPSANHNLDISVIFTASTSKAAGSSSSLGVTPAIGAEPTNNSNVNVNVLDLAPAATTKGKPLKAIWRKLGGNKGKSGKKS